MNGLNSVSAQDLADLRCPVIPQLEKRSPLHTANDSPMRHPLGCDRLKHEMFAREASPGERANEHSSRHFPVQQAARFPKNAEIPSCASSAIAFWDITSFAYAYAPA